MASPRRFLKSHFFLGEGTLHRSNSNWDCYKHTFVRIFKFGHIVSNIELVDNSFTVIWLIFGRQILAF